MAAGIFFGALLGIMVQFAVIYGAIRLALMHDREAPAKKAARVAAAELWRAQHASAKPLP